MKNVKIFFLVMVIAVNSLCMATEKTAKIKELGQLFHYGAIRCKLITERSRKKLEGIEPLAAQLTYSQVLDAVNFEINEKSAIAVARARKCKGCVEWAVMLERVRDTSEFIVNDLHVGHLTRQEILKDPELAKKLEDFESSQFEKAK